MWSIPTSPWSRASVSITRNTWATRSRPSRARRPASFARAAPRCSAAASPSRFSKASRADRRAAQAPRHRIQLCSGRQRLAIPRHALGLAAAAGTGTRGRHPVRQCRDRPRSASRKSTPPHAIQSAAIAQGLRSVRLAARFQVIKPAGSPTWILDVAHNPDAARVLAAQFERATLTPGKTIAVCGILADKDALAIAADFAIPNRRMVVRITRRSAGTRRRGSGEVVRDQVATVGARGRQRTRRLRAAAAQAHPEDRIVVFGSFHTVGPALDWLEARMCRSAASRMNSRWIVASKNV